jgi:hypothetical protein
MRRRIILHIGSPKCGSTYLQQVMVQNSPRLLERGIRYPHDGGSHPGNAADLASVDAARLDAWFADGVHTVVLSHEDLYGLPKRGDALAALAPKAGIEVQLVAFLRPFSEFVFGDYSQFMKQHFETFLARREAYEGRDFRAFAERRVRNLTPAAFLRNWSKRFPERPLILASHRRIRPVIEELLGPDEQMDWELHPTRVNRSLRMEDCDRIAAMMRDPEVSDAEIRAAFREAFHRTDLPDAGRTEERRAWLEAQFEEQNRLLRQQFGYDNTLQTERG